MSDLGAATLIEFDPSTVRGLVFDLDGTLVDSYAAITASVNDVLEHLGRTPLDESRIRAMVGRGLECLMRDVVGDELADEGARRFREHYAEVCLDLTFAFPGTREALATLRHDGVAMSVASNKPARFSRPILERVGLSQFIKIVHGPDSVGSTKPEPTMIRTCVRDMGLQLAECAYVGDMVLDVESARRAGLPVVLVPTGSSSESDLRRASSSVLSGIAALAQSLRRARSR